MKAEFYVKFRPRFRNNRLISIAAMGVTKGRPQDPRGNYAVVRFSVDFDEGMFAVPEVVASIHAPDAEVVAEVLPPFDESTDE